MADLLVIAVSYAPEADSMESRGYMAVPVQALQGLEKAQAKVDGLPASLRVASVAVNLPDKGYLFDLDEDDLHLLPSEEAGLMASVLEQLDDDAAVRVEDAFLLHVLQRAGKYEYLPLQAVIRPYKETFHLLQPDGGEESCAIYYQEVHA